MWVWDTLQERKLARFPFPPHGRIPNFVGAEAAARRLVDALDLRRVRRVKVNPDAPQRPLRALLLEQGVTLFVPTPRLKGGFKRLDPEKIPGEDRKKAAGLSQMDKWAEPVEVRDLPEMDWIVAGSVAVTRSGRRAGKGEGYSDLEYAILRELGHPETPVATTVHALQFVDELPLEHTDIPLSLIVTPDELVDVRTPPSAPRGIDWELLSEEDLEAMPVLRELAPF
jgi:5-formyltetrahydrofolate cyclo-ligase